MRYVRTATRDFLVFSVFLREVPEGRLSCSCTENHMRPEVEKKERKPILGTEVAMRKKGA